VRHSETEMRSHHFSLECYSSGSCFLCRRPSRALALASFIPFFYVSGILRDLCIGTHKFGIKAGFVFWSICLQMRVYPCHFVLYSALAYFAWRKFWIKFYCVFGLMWSAYFGLMWSAYFGLESDLHILGLRGICLSIMCELGDTVKTLRLQIIFSLNWKCTSSLLFFFWFSWSVEDLHHNCMES
jgi:hypothetical protein